MFAGTIRRALITRFKQSNDLGLFGECGWEHEELLAATRGQRAELMTFPHVKLSGTR
jgi:hypothetical protein